MVDAAATRLREGADRYPAPAGATQFVAEAGAAPPVAARDVPMLAGAAQTPFWTDRWQALAARDTVHARLAKDGDTVLHLPLEIIRVGPLRIAGFMGGSHANGNFPRLSAHHATRIAPSDLQRVCTAIAAARPDIDVIALERMAPSLGGTANPFSALPHRHSPNVALATDLGPGFEAILQRIGAKRRRKKHRGQIRKFEAAGGYRRYMAQTPTDAVAIMDRFFAIKAERFRKMGVRDVFGDGNVQAFFRALFADCLPADAPQFRLHVLEVGGRIRAITGGALLADRLTCEFGAIAEDELVHASPGDFLFYENIREACDAAIPLYDFSVGDEPYKRLWCDVETRQFDVMLPLTAGGRIFAASQQFTAAGKAWVKGSPLIWSAIKRLRRRGTAPVEAAPPDDD